MSDQQPSGTDPASSDPTAPVPSVEGASQWQPVAPPPGIQGASQPQSAAPPPGTAWAPVVPPQRLPQASSNAIVALVLAIASWFVLPVIAAIVALILASKATNEIRASNGWLTGEGMALAAKILSWINIAVWTVVVLVFVAIVIAAIAAGGIEPSSVPTDQITAMFGA